MISGFFIIENVDKIVHYGTSKYKVTGTDVNGKSYTAYCDLWMNVKKGEMFYFTEYIEDSKSYLFPDDQKVKHPVFKIGEAYTFKFKEIRIKKNGVHFYVFEGPDLVEYELKLHEWLRPFLKKKNKDYLLVFQGTYKGRVNLKINTFFERESVDESGSLGNFFLFSKLENNKNFIIYTEQYKNKDNRWVLSFSSYLNDCLNDSRNRKDWEEYNRIAELVTNLENWIESSGYLLLFKREDIDKIKYKISDSRYKIDHFLKVVNLIQSFSEEKYLLELSDELSKDDLFVFLNLIVHNSIILEKSNIIQKVLVITIHSTFSKSDALQLIYVISKLIYSNLKDYKARSKEYSDREKNAKITHLIRLHALIFNFSNKSGLLIKSKVSVLKIITLLSELFKDFKSISNGIKKNVFISELSHSIYLHYDIDNILTVVKSDLISKKIFEQDLFDLNSYYDVQLIGKFKNGFFVRYRSHYGILPNILFHKSKIETAIIGSTVGVYLRTFLPDFGLLIFSSYKTNKYDANNSRQLAVYPEDIDFEIGENIICIIRRVEEYGVIVSLPGNKRGLLHKKNIHPFLVKNFKSIFISDNQISATIIGKDTLGFSLSNYKLIHSIFLEPAILSINNISILSFRDNILNLCFNNDIIFPYHKESVHFDSEIDFTKVSSFSSFYKILNNDLYFINQSNILASNEFEFDDFKNYFIEIGFAIEEYSNMEKRREFRYDFLSHAKMIFSFFGHHRSYYIDYFSIYLKHLDRFAAEDNSLLSDLDRFIQEIENDKLLLDSFSSFRYILFHLKLILCFEKVNSESLHQLVDLYFISGFKNIAKEILKHNLNLSEKKDSVHRDQIRLALSEEIIDAYSSEKIFSDIELNDFNDNSSELKEILDLIKSGESNTVEFKETLSVPISDKKRVNERLSKLKSVIETNRNTDKEIDIENRIFEIEAAKPDVLIHSALKNIVAFANTKGGNLFIGVDDLGNITGLQPEYNKFSKIDSNDLFALRDEFKLYLDNLIKEWIDHEIRQYIDIKIHCYKGFDFCHIVISPKRNKNLLFLNYSIEKKSQSKLKSKSWYYRGIANAREYTLEELNSYYTNLIG
jgi:hypothetical protein